MVNSPFGLMCGEFKMDSVQIETHGGMKWKTKKKYTCVGNRKLGQIPPQGERPKSVRS